MKKWIILLSILLIASNGYWLMKYENLVALTHYQSGDLETGSKTINRLMELMPKLASEKSFDEVVVIANTDNITESFEKDGCVWMDKFGLYEEGGKLKEVVSIYNNGESSPCFQLPKNEDIR